MNTSKIKDLILKSEKGTFLRYKIPKTPSEIKTAKTRIFQIWRISTLSPNKKVGIKKR